MVEGDKDSTPQPGPQSGPIPPLGDLTDRPTPTPGPLTKPAPVVRPPRRRPRWVVPVVIVLILAASATALIIWQTSQTGLA